MGDRHFVESHKRLSHHHIRQVEPLGDGFRVIHQVIVPGGDMQVGAEGAVHFHSAGVPVVQGIGIGVYGDLESYEGREHRLLEALLAAGGKPHPIGTDEAHDEGGLLAFDQPYFF